MLVNISFLGEGLLAAVFLLYGFAAVFGLAALKLKIEKAKKILVRARRVAFAAAALSVIVLIQLIIAFLMDDFSIAAVGQYSSAELPFLYKLSAVWAGSAGSLLLWSVAVFVLFALWQIANRKSQSILRSTAKDEMANGDKRLAISDLKFDAAALSIGAGVCLWFSALLIFVAKPFASCPVTLDDGMGLNPLLQNFWMIVHPPLLFVGYSAFLIPFVIVLASVFTGSAESSNTRRQLRRWLLFGICFLGLGIATGARWSYVELGWGGYWAWDPVENASLLPWLIAVAALHSLVGTRIADKFKLWTIVLAPVPFILCLFATFITRSGILASVHTFDRNVMFSALLAFIASCLLLWIVCIIRAAKSISIRPSAPSTLSLDKSKLLFWANVILIFAVVVIGTATFWPIVSRAIPDSDLRFTLTRSFYDRVISVVGILLAFLIGLVALADLQKRSRFVLQVLVCCGVGLVGFGLVIKFGEKRLLLQALSLAICAFSFVAICAKLWVSLKANGKIGTNIAHLGLLLLVVAAGFSSNERSVQIQLARGEKTTLGAYELAYSSFGHKVFTGVTKVGPEIIVTKNGSAKKLWPHNNLYLGGQNTSEVAVHTGLFVDIYISFEGVCRDGRVVIIAKIKPAMLWLWFAAGLIVTGSALPLLERKRGRK